MVSKKAFSLLEMTVVLIIITIIASALVPQLINGYANNAANKTALDMSAIEEASRAYYLAKNAWPGAESGNPMGDLTAGNYLPSQWNPINPFGFSSQNPSKYTYNISASGNSPLQVSTFIPNTFAQTIIQNLLPASWIDKVKNIVYSTVTVPGPLPVLPPGTVLAWPQMTAPAGFLLCDGSIYQVSQYPDVAAVLGSTYGGDGINTFGVPDLRGRSIMGLNPILNNDGSNRVFPNDNYSNDQGVSVQYNNYQLSLPFGEERHRQTAIELAPHNHNFTAYINGVKGFSGESTTAPRDSPSGGTTSTAGGNNDGTGLGAPANVVEPSMAMAYIIKY